MAQDLASLVRAAEARQRAQERGEPLRAAGDSLFVARGRPRTPQQEALAEEAGKVLGLPPSLVDEEAMSQARVRQEMDALSEAHRTAGWLSADPRNAAVARDQVQSLTGIERLMLGVGKVALDPSGYARDLGRRGVAGAFEGLGSGVGGIGRIDQRLSARAGLTEPLPISEFLIEFGERNRRAAEYFRGAEGSERALSSGVPGFLPRMDQQRLGFAGDVAEGLGQITTQVGVAVGTGGFGSLPMLFGQGVTQMDERVQQAQERDGRTEYSVRDDAALVAGGLVTALTEKLGLDAVMGALPAPIRARLTNKLVDVGVAALTEGSSEVAEGIGQNAIARTLLGEDTGLLDGGLVYEGGVGATVGGIARAVLMTAVPGRQHLSNNDRADRALRASEEFNAVVEAANGNDLRRMAPERFADFLKSVADPDAEVVIPADAAVAFFQSNPDLDVWLDEWDIRDQVEEARAAGTDIVMPQAAYLSMVGPTAAHEAWKQDIRFGLGEMSAREAEAFRTEGEAQLEGALDAAIEQAATVDEQVAPVRRVRDDLFRQLREAGYTIDAANTQAEITSRAFARRAERSPQRFADAYAAYEAAGLTVQQEFPTVLRQQMDRLDVMLESLRRQSARPSDRRMFGRSMMEFLAQRGGVQDTGGEMAALGVDGWHRPSQGGRAFRRRFIRQIEGGDNAYAADQAALAAVEAGYLPEGATADDLFRAVAEEMAGRPVYSRQFETDLQAVENADALTELERLMGDLGLDLTADNATIRAALDRASEVDPMGGDSYNQDGRLNTETEAFRAWAGTDQVIEADDVNDFDFNAEGPFVMRAFHGTTHDIEAFDASLGGNTEGQFGAVNYFTTSRADADVNYAGEGPDLTSRIEQRAERIEAESDGEIDMEGARAQARAELSGGRPQTLEVFVRTEKPFVVGDGSPFIEFADFEALEARAIDVVAENNGVSVDDVRSDLDAYQDEIDEARWEAEAESENPLIAAIQTVADRRSIDPSQILEDVSEFSMDGGRQSDLEAALRASEGLAYAEDYDTGGLIGHHVLGEIIQELGFDSIILKNAEDRFSRMEMSPGTAHVHVFDKNKTNIKSVENRGTFDPSDPRILYQSSGESLADIRAAADEQGVKLSITEPRDGISTLSMIDTRGAGQGAGLGTAMMERITAWADRTGTRLALTPEKVGNTSKSRLTAFYKRQGFVENKGRSRDFSVREAMIREPRETFRQDMDQTTPFANPRGQITFTNNRAIVTLFASRDLSTFFHEFGHLTLEMLREDAADPNASDQVKADFQTVLDWFSREAGETITAENIGVDQHELWARGNERYLMEGKAPALELREVFRTVAAWLKNVYRTVLNLNAPLNDDVRAVMDRLIATEDEIAQARAASGQELGVEAFRELGASEAEARAYEAAVSRARTSAEDDLLGKVMRAIRRVRTKEWNDAADQIRPEIAAEVDRMPDIAALDFIATSRTPLDRETVVAMMGDEAGLALLPKRVPPIISATGGQHPDMVAEAAGYRSGQAMLNGLMEYEAEKRRMVADGDKRSVKRARVEARVREALLENYGDPLNDGSIEQEAVDAIHSERYGDVLALDLNVLARRTGNQPAPIQALRVWARERIGSRPVREARPGRYLRAERTASTQAQQALARGDRQEAFRQKQAQTINNVLYVAASEAERFGDAALRRMRRLARGKNPSIHVDYMEQIDALLEQYELKPVSARTIQRRMSLAAFVQQQQDAGEPINIPPEVIEATRKTNLQDLTVDELRGLDDAVKHLVHLGRLKTRLVVQGEQRDLEREVDRAWTSASRLKDRKGDTQVGASNRFQDVVGYLNQGWASLRKAQEIFRRLDGSDTDGAFHDVLDRPGVEAANTKARLEEEFWTPVVAAKNAIPAAVQRRWMDVLEDHPVIDPTTGRMMEGVRRVDMIAMALNVGTLSNFSAASQGWGLVPKGSDALAISTARLNFIGWLNDRLDASEWAYVQAIWDAHERLRPTYFATAREVEGVEPDAVEAEPVETPGGRLAGGYAPLVYHPDFDRGAQRRQEADEADVMGGFMRSGPRPDNGATISRTGYDGFVDLRMESHRSQVNKHITYAAYAGYVSNALRFINHPTVRDVVTKKLGPDVYRTLTPWVAFQVKGDPPFQPNAGWVDKAFRAARSNVVMASLLGSVSVLMAQAGGIPISVGKIGLTRFAAGTGNMLSMIHWWGDGAREFVTSRSDVMRLRIEEGEMDRDIRFALGRTRNEESLRASAASFFGRVIALMDFYTVSGPTWLGVYDAEVAAGRDEADAVYAADMAVRTSQGGGRAIDSSGVLRGSDLAKMGTIAFGWANAFENMVSGSIYDIKQGENRAENTARLMTLLILAPLADAILSGDLPDFSGDDEDPLEAASNWFLRNVLSNLVVGVPLGREIGSWLERKAAGEYTGELGQTPMGRIMGEASRLVNDTWAAMDPEKDVSHRWPSHIISATGLALGIPGTSQAVRSANYLLDVQEGDQNPQNVADVTVGMLRGPQEDQER